MPLLAGALLVAATPAEANWASGRALFQEEGERDWSIDVVPYIWSIGVTGRLGTAEESVTTVTASDGIVEFPSAADALNAAFMGTLEARWRRWALFVDGSWVELGDSEELDPPFESGRWDVSLAQGTVAAAYELPFDIGPAFDVMVGARWWRLGLGLTFVPDDGSPAIPVEDTLVFADAIVGVRVRQPIGERWNAWARADVGGGMAKIDWSLEAGVGWDFNRYVGLVAAYRILGVNYERDEFLYDMTHSGLIVGLRVGF